MRRIISEDNASPSEDRRRLPVTANQVAGSSDKSHKGGTEKPGNPNRHAGAFHTHTHTTIDEVLSSPQPATLSDYNGARGCYSG